jgi:hypothetical protein
MTSRSAGGAKEAEIRGSSAAGGDFRQAVDASHASMAASERPLTFWGLLRHSRLLQWILVFSIFTNFSFGGLVFGVALPALAKGPLAAGATGYGLLLAAFGAAS